MSSRNPWTRVSRRTAYDNPWIVVHHDDVVRPDGQPGIYGVVHYRHRAIGVVPRDADGRVLLVGQHRYPLDVYSWEIPEGGGTFDEDPIVAAKRELREETGLVAHRWTLLGRAHLSNSVSDEEGWYYLAEDLEQHAPDPDGTEELVTRWVAFAEAMEMVRRGEITDSLSVIALQAVALGSAATETGLS